MVGIYWNYFSKTSWFFIFYALISLVVPHGAIHYQFKQLRLVSKLGQWVPHGLSHDQKKNCVSSSHQLFSLQRTNNWLKNLTNWDEKWCLLANIIGNTND